MFPSENHPNKRRILSAAMACALAAALPLCAACSAKTDEDVIRESITRELEGYKGASDPVAEELIEDMDINELAQFDVDTKEFMRSYLDGFDYTIDSIRVDGDTAIVTVTLECKSFSEYEEALGEATAGLTSDESIAAMPSDQLNELFGSIILDSLEKVQVAKTDPVTIEYTKAGNTWKPSASAAFDITSALMSN